MNLLVSLRQFSRRASVLTLLLGCMVMLGWMLHIPELKSVVPGFVTMKVNTALALILAGLSLQVWHFIQTDFPKRSVFFARVSRGQWYGLANSLATMVVLIGLLTLIQYGFQVNLGIDQLLLPDDPTAIHTSTPGRMAPNTALSFLFLGSALLLLYHQIYSPAQLFALGTICISGLGALGYLYGLNSLYNLTSYTAMALHTSLGLSLLSLATLLACPDQGWIRVITSPYAGSVFVRRLLPMIIVIPLLLGGGFLAWYRRFAIGIEVGFIIRSILNILLIGGLLGWQAQFLNRLDEQRQQAEEELRKSHQELEDRVAERTLQLAESRRQLSNLINTLPGIVFVRHAHGNFGMHYISYGCLTLTGYSSDHLTGCSHVLYNDLIHPEDLPQLFQSIEQAIIHQKPYQVEYRIINRFNREKWFWEQGNGVWNELGQLVSLEGFIIDISDRKQAEKALIESEAKFRLLAENIQEVFFINGGDLKQMLYVSPTYETVWGRSCHSLYESPQTWIDSIHPEDQASVLLACQEMLQGKEFKQEYRIIRPDGSLRWIRSRTFPVLAETGHPISHPGLAEDITAYKQAEIDLRYSEQRYRSLVQATSQLIWTTDATGQIVEEQPSWGEYTGQSFSDYQGWGWKQAVHPDDQERTMSIWSQALATRSLYENESQIRNSAGNYRYFWVRAVPILEEDGTVREWVGTCTDITERKQAEFALHQLNQELEQRVKQRTTELEAINTELEAFCYSVSHDLRAPLRNIDGFSQVLLEHYAHQLDDKGQHYLSRIRANIQRMTELIEDLLALSRVSRTELRRVSVNLTAIAKEIAQTLSETEPQRQIQWQIAPELIVQGDRRLLQVVLENLLNNAWKFTSHRPEPQIEFNGGLHPETGEFMYWVKDNGAGFNMAYAHKLFGVFQRLHSAIEFPGTGIGLATVQRIIHRHGGRVWAVGTPNEGATFYFSL